MKTLGLVFMTKNEIVGLRALFDRIPIENFDEVFAVDGGSTDGTIDFFQSKSVAVYSQEIKGRGAGFRLAFEKSKSDALVFFSPDGNENPADLMKFRPYLQEGYDMVIASRMMKGARFKGDNRIIKIRKWSNNFANHIANTLWNKCNYITDSINGYRAISRNMWQRIVTNDSGHVIEHQATIEAFKQKMKIIEFPTIESFRVDGGRGVPMLRTASTFVKFYIAELFK